MNHAKGFARERGIKMNHAKRFVRERGLCATLSTDEFQQENVFTMYPNPAKDVVTLQYDLAVANATVEVFDLTGRLIKNVALNSFSGTNELNVSAYPAGIYLVLVKQGAAVVSSSKLVVE
jgi:hypothetical protein